MTQKEFLSAVISANLSEEISEKANEMLATLNKKSASADKAKAETALRRENVLATLTTSPVLPDTIADKLGLTKGQVVSALTALVKDGIATKFEVKIDKAKKTAYALNESGVGSAE